MLLLFSIGFPGFLFAIFYESSWIFIIFYGCLCDLCCYVLWSFLFFFVIFCGLSCMCSVIFYWILGMFLLFSLYCLRFLLLCSIGCLYVFWDFLWSCLRFFVNFHRFSRIFTYVLLNVMGVFFCVLFLCFCPVSFLLCFIVVPVTFCDFPMEIYFLFVLISIDLLGSFVILYWFFCECFVIFYRFFWDFLLFRLCTFCWFLCGCFVCFSGNL